VPTLIGKPNYLHQFFLVAVMPYNLFIPMHSLCLWWACTHHSASGISMCLGALGKGKQCRPCAADFSFCLCILYHRPPVLLLLAQDKNLLHVNF